MSDDEYFTACERLGTDSGWKDCPAAIKSMFCRSCRIRGRCDDKIDLKEKTCYLDGNALCIVSYDFIDLQVSDAMFIELTPEQIEEFNNIGKKKEKQKLEKCVNCAELFDPDKTKLGLTVCSKECHDRLRISLNEIR